MHRFFLLDQPLASGQIISLAPLAHQLSAVLRLQPPDRILLLDGSGRSFIAEIQSLSRNHGTATLLAEQPCPAEPSIELTLYQCSLKQDKFEWVLQKGTELGVARFVPVISARSVVRPAQVLKRKYERWRAILARGGRTEWPLSPAGAGRSAGLDGRRTFADWRRLPALGSRPRRSRAGRSSSTIHNSQFTIHNSHRPRRRHHPGRSHRSPNPRLALGDPGAAHPACRDSGAGRRRRGHGTLWTVGRRIVDVNTAMAYNSL